MTRKSKMIGQTIKGFKILDSFRVNSQTKFKCECVKCGYIQNKGWHTIKDNEPICENCGNARIYHNVRKEDKNSDILKEYRYMLVRVKAKNKNYLRNGIKVCDEWQNDFQAFNEWAIKNGYKKGLTLDRIDNNGNYEPLNCRWATIKQQQNNRSTNIIVSYKGEQLTVAQCADKYNIPRYLVYQRIRAGKSIQEAIEMPIDKSKWSKKYKIKKEQLI